MTTARSPLRNVARLAVLGLGLLLAHQPWAIAHEARPAYLELTETQADRYDVTWRTPVSAGQRLPVVLHLPVDARAIVEPAVREFVDSVVERQVISLPGGLAGKRVDFIGLEATITDVLVRVEARDGSRSTMLVQPAHPTLEFVPTVGAFIVAGAYLVHGVEHILFGYDHLLFVFALMLIVRNVRVLVATVTAFTIAHSITLALATLGVVRVPGPPVEAAIALSILLLACEIPRMRAGQPSLTAKWPWLVAFSFGLLHGFGFASALAEIGLPKSDVPLALLTFNVGVEIGQLSFIAVVLVSFAILRRGAIPRLVMETARPVMTFVVGTLAAFWFFERIAGFV